MTGENIAEVTAELTGLVQSDDVDDQSSENLNVVTNVFETTVQLIETGEIEVDEMVSVHDPTLIMIIVMVIYFLVCKQHSQHLGWHSGLARRCHTERLFKVCTNSSP